MQPALQEPQRAETTPGFRPQKQPWAQCPCHHTTEVLSSKFEWYVQRSHAILFLSLIGERCDRHGVPLPPDTPPEVPPAKADDDWSPFASRAGFELSEFIFTDAELSQRKIDKLLELWAATLIPHGSSPPFSNHQNLLEQIDAIKLGSTQWESTCLQYKGPLPETPHRPEWMKAQYDVWYRNPREVIKSILARKDIEGHIDYAAYRKFNSEQRQYSNLMSGDWAWNQSVRLIEPVVLLIRLPPLPTGCDRRRPFNPWLYVHPGHLGVRQNDGFRGNRSK